MFDELAHAKAKNRVFMIVGPRADSCRSAPTARPADSDGERLDLAEFGTFARIHRDHGSNKPFGLKWQVHSGELLAVINVKDFD